MENQENQVVTPEEVKQEEQQESTAVMQDDDGTIKIDLSELNKPKEDAILKQ